MPEHTSFITYVLALPAFSTLRENAHTIGKSVMGGKPVGYRGLEPIFTSIFVILLVVYLAGEIRGELRKLDESYEPEDKLTLRTFFEAFFGYFYQVAKDVMGTENAKRYFHIIGGTAAFIFFSNILGLVPGFTPPTSNLNVTLGCALYIFIAFNYFGFKENGLGYLKHMAGPMWALAPLIFPIELISTCVRPLTLAVRLMVNMAIDHLGVSIFLGLIAFLVPVPLMMLGIITILVQTLVFCLLSAVYIGLATEHTEHHDHGGAAHAGAHH